MYLAGRPPYLFSFALEVSYYRMSQWSTMSDQGAFLASMEGNRLSFDGCVDEAIEDGQCNRSRLLAMGCTVWGHYIKLTPLLPAG